MVISDELSQYPDLPRERLERLRALAGRGPVLIVTHDNPDPDALASGVGLATLFETAWGIECDLVYFGLVARAENRVMLNRLASRWIQAETFPDISRYTGLAMVDTQPGAGNNRVPVDLVPQMVFDHHHPRREALEKIPYVEVRPEVGATVSIIFLYLTAAEIELEPLLATAMFYGLQTDTRGLARGAAPLDEWTYVRLLSLLDRRELIRVEQAGLSQEYFQAFTRGLQAARVHGRAVVAYLGEMAWPDLSAELADLVIRYQNADAALCLGIHKDTLYLSIRTEPLTQDAGLLVQEVIVPPGKAGGHGTMAGGQVPLQGVDLEKVVAAIEKRFLVVMGADDHWEPLLGD